MKATRTTGQINRELHSIFYLILRKAMTVDEHDIANMVAEVKATSWRLRETIRVRELAASHRLGQMRRLMMLEEQKAYSERSTSTVLRRQPR